MLTQAMPAVIDALRSVLSPGELQNLTQAIGNCQQPLTHRGSVNFAPGSPPQKGGVYTHSPWNPQQTSLPSAGSHAGVDIPGMQANWNAGNRYDAQFFFPQEDYFTQNQFFGGPQHYVQNHAHMEYITNETFEGNNFTTNNITIEETINGEPIAGTPGAAGGEGREGRPGAPGFNGFPGRDGAIPRGQFRDLRYLAGIKPRINFQNENVIQAPLRYVAEPYVRALTTIHAATGAISGGTADFTVAPQSFTVLTGVSFNPDTCSIVVTGTATIFGFPSTPAITFTGTEASYLAVSAITGAATRASSFPLPEIGVLCRDPDRPLFAQAAEVVVCRDPELKGVIPSLARVFQE
jgi:hypothetical protein